MTLRIGVNALYLIPGGVGGTEIYLRSLLPALAGIKRAAEAAQPYARPELAAAANRDFARAWVDEAHWEALERAQERKRG